MTVEVRRPATGVSTTEPRPNGETPVAGKVAGTKKVAVARQSAVVKKAAATKKTPSRNAASKTLATAKAAPKKANASTKGARKKAFTASIYPNDHGTVPAPLARAVSALETELGKPVWLLLHTRAHHAQFGQLDDRVRNAFFRARRELRKCDRGVALVVDSPGGDASAAYQIATMMSRACGSFTAIVPRMAKSAATLLVLGGDELFLGHDAELGPIDAQVWDGDREEYSSALDEVQALERLNSIALDQIDQAMFLLLGRTGKKIDALLPHVLHFVAEMMQPLLNKIDTVHYTQRSRVLKVAEDYAVRLLSPRHSEDDAKDIARRLVNNYPEHGFAIDREELEGMMLVGTPSPAAQACIDDLEEFLTFTNPIIALGRLIERTP